MRIIHDRIQLGNSASQRIRLHGRNLRIARIATNKRDETPQWWAPKEEDSGGIRKGLWKTSTADDSNRVFYSTSDKSGSHTLSVESTKLTHRVDDNENRNIRPEGNAWNPELLELCMLGFNDPTEAEHYAMFIHQQRFAEDYRDALTLPLIQHIAELTTQYGLPHNDEPDKEPETRPDTIEPDEQFN